MPHRIEGQHGLTIGTLSHPVAILSATRASRAPSKIDAGTKRRSSFSSSMSDLTRVIELFQLPFMQRALMGSILTSLMGGLLGSFTILWQLSFF